MLLGRTASGLYWMHRYIERAENIARVVDAGLRMALSDPQRFVRATAARAVAALNAAGFQLVGEEVRKGDWQAASLTTSITCWRESAAVSS